METKVLLPQELRERAVEPAVVQELRKRAAEPGLRKLAMEPAVPLANRHRDALEWLESAKLLKVDPASRSSCRVCKIAREICRRPSTDSLCKICVAKAAAVERVELAGGSIRGVGEEPVFRLEESSLAGRDVIKTWAMEVRKASRKVALVRLPYDQIKDTLKRRPRKPLHPLSDAFFHGNPDLREAVLIGSSAALASILTEEDILHQYFAYGYASVLVEVIEGK